MYRIKKMTSPTGVDIDKNVFMEFGKRLDGVVKRKFMNGMRDIVVSTNSLIEDENEIGGVKLIDFLTIGNNHSSDEILQYNERNQNNSNTVNQNENLQQIQNQNEMDNSITEDILDSFD